MTQPGSLPARDLISLLSWLIHDADALRPNLQEASIKDKSLCAVGEGKPGRLKTQGELLW